MSAPGPPPVQRKVKHVNVLKGVQTEQSQKLQQKHALEQELLEDIRAYCKLRTGIEREYAQSLQKTVAQFLQKFAPKTLEKEEARTPFGLWRRILEDTDEVAKSRLDIAQSLTDNVSENIKTLKTARAQTVKKCTALGEKLHQEMQVSVQDMVDCQKGYMEHRKILLQTTEQLHEAKDKMKRGSGTFFQSKAKLEKNVTKLQEKWEVSQRRATVARNDYLLSLTAVNAHQQRYYSTDLPELIAVQDGDIYARFHEYLTEITSLEIHHSESNAEMFKKLLENVSQLQRAYAIQFFLKQNPVFTKCSPYEFQLVQDDEDPVLTDKHGAGLHLNKEARKWASRLIREQKMIEKKTKEWRHLLAQQASQGQDESKPADGNTVSPSISDVLEELRHLEVLRTKAEARLELLRHAGVNVDEWIQSAMQEQEAEEVEEAVEDVEGIEDDWDEDREFLSPDLDYNDSISVASAHSQVTQKVVAIYSFQAAGEEELSITENEELELIERELDGWMKGRNKHGQVGFFPESYVEIVPPSVTRAVSDDVASSPLSSVSQDRLEVESRSSNSSDRNQVEHICVVKALYDYTAAEDGELSFKEGDIIMVTNKNEDVDDGWWEGVLDNRKGVFPFIVVEELGAEAQGCSKEWPMYERKSTLTDNNYSTLPRVKTREQRQDLTQENS